MTNIQATASIIFWISVLGVFITYIGFPYLFLKLIAPIVYRKKPTDIRAFNDDNLPSVTVLVPAHNEENHIGARIENLLESDYPKEKLQILIASDQSNDRTVEIVRSYVDRGVELIEMPDRSGKFGILDSIIPIAKHDIVVITDANIEFRKNAIKKLIQPYSDPRVGAVCGVLNRIPPLSGKNVEGEGQFAGYESNIKIGLSKLGRVIGAFGGFYSLRKKLFRPLGSTPVHDDLVIPLEVRALGYRVLMIPEASASEETLDTIKAEFGRRTRMAAYNFLSIPRVLSLSWKAGFLDFILVICYKILRWISPFLFASGAVSIFLICDFCPFYQTTAILIGAIIILALIGGFLDKFGKRVIFATSAFHFLAMNIAGILGAYHAFKGVKRYWESRE